MNTPTISTALPAAPSPSGAPKMGSSPEPDASTPSFSSVLTRQQTPEAAPKAVPSTAAEPKKNGAGNPASDAAEATETTDEALAEQATEQGLSLPQIALNIAAEVALAMAARQPATSVSAKATTPAGIAELARAGQSKGTAESSQAIAAALATDKLPADALRATAATAAQAATPALKLDTPAAAGSKAIELPAGFVPVQTEALPHQTELELRKAPATAGSRKAGLAAQPVATDFTTAKTATADAAALIADTASASARTSFAAASAAIDLSASQAGSITAASGTAASTTLLSGNLGSVANTGAQPALPGISTPLQNPQWGADFSRQFVSLTQGGHNMPHTAELRLDPPELGPLRISINISDNVAHAVFTSAHAAVRQTVENSLPQLQQLLAQAGISLGQTSVNDQGQADQSFNESFGASGKATAVTGAAGDTASLSAGSATRVRASDALVDTFA